MIERNTSTPRPLAIDLDLYTEGDPDFKRELISHLIANLRELQRTLPDLDPNASINFIKVLHKVKATVTMLNDIEFMETVEEIKASIISNQPLEFFKRKLGLLSGLCDQVIESLTAEANNLTWRSAHS